MNLDASDVNVVAFEQKGCQPVEKWPGAHILSVP
jgi:hypothetical protein